MDAIVNHQNFTRHRGPITCATEIPGTHTIITSGYDSAVALFDRAGGEVSLLGYHQHLVNRVSVNNTGSLAASCSSDYNIYIWDVVSRCLKTVLQGHDDDVEDFVFIDEHLGASVSRDWRVIIWNLDTGSIQRVLRGHSKDVLSINYLDGQLFTSGDDMTLRVWDIFSGVQTSIWGPFESEADTCAIDPINQRVILGCDDGRVRVFDIHSGELLSCIDAHSAGIKKVAASPTTGDILSAAYDQKILIWDTATYQLKKRLENQTGLWERSFNWSPDGQRIIAGTFDGTVLVWDSFTGRCIQELGYSDTNKGNTCFNDIAAQNDNQIVVVSDDGHVRVGQFANGTTRWRAQATPNNGPVLMNSIAVDQQSQKIIAGAHNQKLHFFDTHNGQLQEQASIHLQQGPINSIRTSQLAATQGQVFAGCYSGAVVRLSANGQPLNTIKAHANAVKALRLHPTRNIGVSCGADGSIVAWDYAGQIINTYAGHTAIVDDVDIDPNGQLIASTGRDFTLKIHGLDNAVLYHSIALGRRSPKALCFISSTVVIVTNYWGELIRVSLDDESIIRTSLSDNGISSMVLLDGQLAAAAYDGAVYLVDPNDLSVIQTLRSMTQKVAPPIYA